MSSNTQAFSRDGLIAAILEFIGEQDLLTLQDIRSALEREVDAAGRDGLLALKARLTSDTGWDYYPRSAAGGDRRVAMDALGLAIAALTPVSYQGVYADVNRYPQAAEVLRQVGCKSST